MKIDLNPHRFMTQAAISPLNRHVTLNGGRGGTKVQLNGKQLPHDGLAERILIRKGDSTSGLETR